MIGVTLACLATDLDEAVGKLLWGGVDGACDLRRDCGSGGFSLPLPSAAPPSRLGARGRGGRAQLANGLSVERGGGVRHPPEEQGRQEVGPRVAVRVDVVHVLQPPLLRCLSFTALHRRNRSVGHCCLVIAAWSLLLGHCWLLAANC